RCHQSDQGWRVVDCRRRQARSLRLWQLPDLLSRIQRMALSDQPLVDILAAFRSSDPTPGGGSASALSGAIGASLLAMVAGLPKARAESEEDVERLQAAGARCAELAGALTGLVDRDSDAYDLVVAAYKKPK